MLTNQMMDTWTTGTLEALQRNSQPPLTAQDYRQHILDDIRTAQADDKVVFGRVLISISDMRGYMDGVAQRIAELEAQLLIADMDNDRLSRRINAEPTPAPAEVTPEPVEWLTVSQYAKAHARPYSTIAGKKNYFGAGMTRQDPNHKGRWQIRADAPYPMKRNN